MEKGFTLIEVLLVVGVLAILLTLAIPVTIDFYKSQQLDTHTQGIIQTLRRAQLKAMSIEEDSSFGVFLTNDNYILFRGNSFATRDAAFDEIFDLPVVITVQDSPKDVVFSKFEGKPNAIGSIILSNDGLIQVININEIGRINLE